MKNMLFCLLVSWLMPSSAFSQNCKCEQEFKFLIAQVENNYAGFKDKVKNTDAQSYLHFTSGILKKASAVLTDYYCLGLMNEWLNFFKDGHLQIGENGNSSPPLDSLQIELRIDQAEIIELSEKTIAKLSTAKGIEGIYYSTDSSYKIALIKSVTANRDYAGIIVESKSSLWSPGQVKLEIKQLATDRFTGYAYLRDHTVNYRQFKCEAGSLNNGEWIKDGFLKPVSNLIIQPISSKLLSSKTFYLQISSFDEWNAGAIDSVLKANSTILSSTQNLILDLRGNGGGVDFAYKPLLPYLYTNPVKTIGVDVIASEDNIKGYEEVLGYEGIPQDTKDEIKAMIKKMKMSVGKFISIVNDDSIVFDRIEKYPQKVVILIDKLCKSSTEEFLLSAKQSKKVTLMGTNSGGVLDYANMRKAQLNCFPFEFWYATTRSRRVDNEKGIDNIGIKPNILLSGKDDYLKKAIEYLEK